MDKERVEIYLQVLACPKCKGDLEYIEIDYDRFPEIKEGFLCKKCKLLFPIKEDIPDMLLEEALDWSHERS
ncbi:MAG: Trm112 family protein [Caldimicrobium sp.]